MLVLGALTIALATSIWELFMATVLIGVASGVGQTAALTAMMRRAQGSTGTEMISAVWNIGFDCGPGIGAVVATPIIGG